MKICDPVGPTTTGAAGVIENGGAATIDEMFSGLVIPAFETVTGSVALLPTPTLPKFNDAALNAKNGPGAGGISGPAVKMVTEPPTASVTSALVFVNIFTVTLPLPSKNLRLIVVNFVLTFAGHEKVIVVPVPNCDVTLNVSTCDPLAKLRKSTNDP